MLSKTTRPHTEYEFPSTVHFFRALFDRLGIGKNNYVYPPLLEIFMNSILTGATAKTDANAKAADLLIQPDLALVPLLGLTQKKVAALRKVGHAAATQVLSSMTPEQLKKFQL